MVIGNLCERYRMKYNIKLEIGKKIKLILFIKWDEIEKYLDVVWYVIIYLIKVVMVIGWNFLFRWLGRVKK